VRRRLDLRRTAERIRQQERAVWLLRAPAGRNRQRWNLLFINDPDGHRRLSQLGLLRLGHSSELRFDSAPGPQR